MSRLVYGLRPVDELLRSKKTVSALYVSEQRERERAAVEALERLARAAQVPIIPRTVGELDALAEGKLHQGVIAVAGDYPYCEPLDLVALAGDRDEAPLLLVLDGVQDPQNLGALVRSAHVLGAHGLIIPRDRAAQVTAAVVKASAGATEHTRIAKCTNVARTLDELKETGVWTVGTCASSDDSEGVDPSEIDFTGATAIVLGAEGQGVRPLVLRGCDHKVRIPMVGRVASLNVAAAGAILLYEALRQRRAVKK